MKEKTTKGVCAALLICGAIAMALLHVSNWGWLLGFALLLVLDL